MAIYIRCEGMKGDVTAKGFEDCFEAQSVSLGLSRQCTMITGSNNNREFNVPQFHELSISKVMDQASHSIFEKALGNQGLKIECFFVKTSEEGKAQKFMTYTFEECLLSSLSIGASAHGDPQENISVAYDQVTMEHTPIGKNNKVGQPKLAGYCISAGEQAIS